MATDTSVTDKQIKILTRLIADCQDRIAYWRELQDCADAALEITKSAHDGLLWLYAHAEVTRNLKAIELLERDLLDVKRQDIYRLGES